MTNIQFTILAYWQSKIQRMLAEPDRYLAEDLEVATEALGNVEALQRTGEVDINGPQYQQIKAWVNGNSERYAKPVDELSREFQIVGGKAFWCPDQESVAIDIVMQNRDGVPIAEFYRAVWGGPYIRDKKHRSRVDRLNNRINNRLMALDVRLLFGVKGGLVGVERPPA